MVLTVASMLCFIKYTVLNISYFMKAISVCVRVCLCVRKSSAYEH